MTRRSETADRSQGAALARDGTAENTDKIAADRMGAGIVGGRRRRAIRILRIIAQSARENLARA